MLEAPGEGGLPRDVATALVAAAWAHGLRVIAHAGSPGAYTLALDVGADVITHMPLGAPITDHDMTRIVTDGRVVIPTLDMMRGLAGPLGLPPGAYAVSARGVGALHAAGVPILAGTDANATSGVPYQPAFGASLHDELALLVDAGLTTAAALRAATCLPAKHFGLSDRGAIEPGLRADLVLLDADPLADITATRAIRRVWLAGVEPTPSGETPARP